MSEPKYKASFIPAAEFVAKHKKLPIILHYQPETFAVLESPEDLRQWEADLREKVGLPGGLSATLETPTESGCTVDSDTD